MKNRKSIRFAYLRLGTLSIFALVLFGMAYNIDRDEHISLFSGYIALSILYLFFYRYLAQNKQGVRIGLIGSIFLQLLLITAVPLLSDDVYRFIWDGRLILNGIHPFAAVPADYVKEGAPALQGITPALFSQLNSPEYFTIYPPFSQFIFVLSAWLSDSVLGNIILIRSAIILAQTLNLWLVIRLLKHFKLPQKRVLLYALNPLVILELTGNLHFEAFMITFTLLSLYLLLVCKKDTLSAISMAMAIGSKLIPLIFLPLFLFRFPFKKLVRFYGVITLTCFLLFAPLWSKELIIGMQNSISLYFQKFEFNASIYYLIRQLGYWIKGYNVIETAGKLLALSTFLAIMGYSLWEKGKKHPLPQAMLWSLAIYLLFTTTLHPWYILPLLTLSLFTPYRFTVLWSILIFFTYINYQSNGYLENLWVVSFEYLTVCAFVTAEIYQNSKNKAAQLIKETANINS